MERIKKYGITLEEFSIIARCNGVYTDTYRPDENEIETEKSLLKNIRNLKNKQSEILKAYKMRTSRKDNETSDYNNNYCDINEILSHNPETNQDCKIKNSIKVKKANYEYFKVCIYASVRRHKFFLVTNTSRKALKQTGDGHFSSIPAYHEKSDSLLMLDSARFKYNSMWFHSNNVFNSFLPLDSTTKKFRGFLLCSKYY